MERTKLTAARYDQGWSQERLAEHIGVSRVTVSQWERGCTHPYPIHVHRLCQLFGKTAEELDLAHPSSSPQSRTEHPMEEQSQDGPIARKDYSHLMEGRIAFYETLEAYGSLLPNY
jgi:DNA-binding XRE family transcriptional regulator